MRIEQWDSANGVDGVPLLFTFSPMHAKNAYSLEVWHSASQYTRLHDFRVCPTVSHNELHLFRM